MNVKSQDPQTSPQDTPPHSRSTSQSGSKRSPALSLDLSDLPPLVQPTPPSNTLLVTNLIDPAIFAPSTLTHIRELIESQAPDGIHTFSPLRGLRRIIISFPTIDSAIAIRSLLDGETLLGSRIRVHFGEPTPLELPDQHLQAPKAEKQFLISPPVSPPMGWEHKEEDPPNKEVHAMDLAHALERLNAARDVHIPPPAEKSPVAKDKARARSGSVVLYNPEDHGHSPDLPAIAVEDLTDNEAETSPEDSVEEARRMIAPTSRPPVELMSDA